MDTHTSPTIHPEVLDQDEYFTHLASVDAHADILMDRAIQSTLSGDQKQELAELMELMRSVAESRDYDASETYKLAIPA